MLFYIKLENRRSPVNRSNLYYVSIINIFLSVFQQEMLLILYVPIRLRFLFLQVKIPVLVCRTLKTASVPKPIVFGLFPVRGFNDKNVLKMSFHSFRGINDNKLDSTDLSVFPRLV